MIKTDSKRSCIICGEEKEFFDLDYLRTKPSQMKVCSTCGFIFSDRFFNEEEQAVYYETKFKERTVNANFLTVVNRKVGYLEATIGKYLKENKDLKICDLGAGIGYMLKWAKEKYGHTRIFGVEPDIKLRRYAKNVFKIDLTKDFDDTQKYDLILMNHILEHAIDPIKELELAKSALTDKGKIYISSPVWMDSISFLDSGQEGNFDKLFDEDHINCWTKEQLEYLFKQVGLKIEKKVLMQGSTYILSPIPIIHGVNKGEEIVGTVRIDMGGENTLTIVDKFNPTKNGKEVEIELIDMKRAIEAFRKVSFREAIRIYPKFVDAYIAESGLQQGKFDLQMKILDSGLKLCPNSVALKTNKALLFFQYNMLEESQKWFMASIKDHPHDENLLFHLAMIHFKYGEQCYAENKIKSGNENWNECLSFFGIILNINPSHHQEIYNFIGYIYSNRILNGEEIKDNTPKFKVPSSKNAPDIELGV